MWQRATVCAVEGYVLFRVGWRGQGQRWGLERKTGAVSELPVFVLVAAYRQILTTYTYFSRKMNTF